MVLEDSGRFYKIPKPSQFKLGSSSYLYHRTTYKGFLKLIDDEYEAQQGLE